jgi:hypothetical protein
MHMAGPQPEEMHLPAAHRAVCCSQPACQAVSPSFCLSAEPRVNHPQPDSATRPLQPFTRRMLVRRGRSDLSRSGRKRWCMRH